MNYFMKRLIFIQIVTRGPGRGGERRLLGRVLGMLLGK